MDIKSSKPLFTLSVAAEIIGVHPRTLMIYEKEGLLTPTRTPTNRRRFSHEDLKKLQFIRYLTSKKNINLAGVETILEIFEKLKPTNPQVQKQLFPDFEEKEII